MFFFARCYVRRKNSIHAQCAVQSLPLLPFFIPHPSGFCQGRPAVNTIRRRVAVFGISRMLTRSIFVQQWKSVAAGGRGRVVARFKYCAASFGAATIIDALFQRRETRLPRVQRWTSFREIKNRDTKILECGVGGSMYTLVISKPSRN